MTIVEKESPVPPELFHVGYVVADLAEARRTFGRVHGLQWTDTVSFDGVFVTPSGPLLTPMELVYSIGPGTRVELIQHQEGTLWALDPTLPPGPTRPGESVLHHLGYWADDLRDAAAGLVAEGFDLRATAGRDVLRPRIMTYHRRAGEPYTELVDAAARADLEAWFAGASFPL